MRKVDNQLSGARLPILVIDSSVLLARRSATQTARRVLAVTSQQSTQLPKLLNNVAVAETFTIDTYQCAVAVAAHNHYYNSIVVMRRVINESISECDTGTNTKTIRQCITA